MLKIMQILNFRDNQNKKCCVRFVLHHDNRGLGSVSDLWLAAQNITAAHLH
jgi:hypothetical protein